MNKCQQCGNYFPNKININGVNRNLQRRKYCIDCSPFNGHNTRKLEYTGKVVDTKETTENYTCPKHGKESVTIHGDRLKCKICVVDWNKDFRTRRKEKLVSIFGGKCVICGYCKCIHALQFHHLDPQIKENNISTLYSNWQNLLDEVIKCILVCANCHAEIEYGNLKYDPIKYPQIIKTIEML